MTSLLWALLLPAAYSQDSEISAVEQLVQILEQSSTLSADVEMLVLDQDGRELQETRARLIMAKPDHFYWEIISPYNELMLIDGEKIWHFEPDLDQVTIQDFIADINRTPVLLLNGDVESLEGSYIISHSTLADNSRSRFVLLPRDPASLFERLSLTFEVDRLEEMQFEDSLGQKTSLFFTNVTTNLELDEQQFEFEVPEGIEVIDNSGN